MCVSEKTKEHGLNKFKIKKTTQ